MFELGNGTGNECGCRISASKHRSHFKSMNDIILFYSFEALELDTMHHKSIYLQV